MKFHMKLSNIKSFGTVCDQLKKKIPICVQCVRGSVTKRATNIAAAAIMINESLHCIAAKKSARYLEKGTHVKSSISATIAKKKKFI